MKNIILLVIIIAAAFFAFNYFQSSKADLPEDARRVVELDERFDSMNSSMQQAMRSGAVSGLDTTSDIEASMSEVKRIEKELKSLKLESDEAQEKAAALKNKISQFNRKYGN